MLIKFVLLIGEQGIYHALQFSFYILKSFWIRIFGFQ